MVRNSFIDCVLNPDQKYFVTTRIDGCDKFNKINWVFTEICNSFDIYRDGVFLANTICISQLENYIYSDFDHHNEAHNYIVVEVDSSDIASFPRCGVNAVKPCQSDIPCCLDSHESICSLS